MISTIPRTRREAHAVHVMATHAVARYRREREPCPCDMCAVAERIVSAMQLRDEAAACSRWDGLIP